MKARPHATADLGTDRFIVGDTIIIKESFRRRAGALFSVQLRDQYFRALPSKELITPKDFAIVLDVESWPKIKVYSSTGGTGWIASIFFVKLETK